MLILALSVVSPSDIFQFSLNPIPTHSLHDFSVPGHRPAFSIRRLEFPPLPYTSFPNPTRLVSLPTRTTSLRAGADPRISNFRFVRPPIDTVAIHTHTPPPSNTFHLAIHSPLRFERLASGAIASIASIPALYQPFPHPSPSLYDLHTPARSSLLQTSDSSVAIHIPLPIQHLSRSHPIP